MKGRVFQISLRGKGKILFTQCSGMINFAGGIFLLGGGNLTRSDFDRSENYYLVEGNEPLVGGGWGRGEQKFGGKGVYWGGGDFSCWEGMSKVLASGRELPPIPLSRGNPETWPVDRYKQGQYFSQTF